MKKWIFTTNKYNRSTNKKFDSFKELVEFIYKKLAFDNIEAISLDSILESVYEEIYNNYDENNIDLTIPIFEKFNIVINNGDDIETRLLELPFEEKVKMVNCLFFEYGKFDEDYQYFLYYENDKGEEILIETEDELIKILNTSNPLDNKEYVLVIANHDWADEFDIFGFKIYEKQVYEQMEKEILTCLDFVYNREIEKLKNAGKQDWYYHAFFKCNFGTNQKIEYDNARDYGFESKEITIEEKETLEKLFAEQLKFPHITTAVGQFLLDDLYEQVMGYFSGHEDFDDMDEYYNEED